MIGITSSAPATTAERPVSLVCESAGAARVRISGALSPGRARFAGKLQVRGALEVDVWHARRKVLGQRIRVVGAMDVKERAATLAALDNDDVAVIRVELAKRSGSYIEHAGRRYPMSCRLE